MLFDLPFDYVLGMGAWLVLLGGLLTQLVAMRRRWTRSRPTRARWVNAGLSLWILLAGLTVVELYFAVVYDQSDSFDMTNVSKHWFRRHVEPDQKPLRFRDQQQIVYRDDREFPRTIAAGQHHICFIGDSFTFAHGVPRVADRFSNRIREDLDRQFPGRFVVSNLADAGREIHWIELVVRKLVDDHLPVQTLVYVVCLNDIETFGRESAELYATLDKHAPRMFLFRETYFFNLLYYRIQQARLPQVTGYYSFLNESYSGPPWDGMRSKLDDLRRLCDEGHINLRIVIFPFLHNLGPDYPFDVGHQRIGDYCHETGLRLLDLKSALLPHVGEGLTVNRFDAHPNERAHAIAAEAIEKELLGDLLPKAGDH